MRKKSIVIALLLVTFAGVVAIVNQRSIRVSYHRYQMQRNYDATFAEDEDLGGGFRGITLAASYDAYETMDIDSATPKGSTITAFLFDTYRTFDLFGTTFELRLCIGITKDELEYKMNTDGETLKRLLQTHGIYPYTDLFRPSIPLSGIE